MTPPHHEFRDHRTPLAYLITFRSYGTWLHGREGSVDRFHNVYGKPKLHANERRRQYNLRSLTQRPVRLGRHRRTAVESGVRETCEIRRWRLWAFNIRTNHVHSVVSAATSPENVLSAFKANATREMRESGCWQSERSPWAFGGSKRRIWNEQQLINAIAYVLYEQGDPLR